MGDRCWLTITTDKKGKKFFEDEWGEGEDYDREGQTYTIHHYEINYGGYDTLHEAAAQGHAFIAYNGAGGEYGPGATVAIGKEIEEVCVMHDGSYPVVEVPADGVLSPEAMARAMRYHILYARVTAYFDILEKLPED